jgi:hypothetical protein
MSLGVKDHSDLKCRRRPTDEIPLTRFSTSAVRGRIKDMYGPTDSGAGVSNHVAEVNSNSQAAEPTTEFHRRWGNSTGLD